jgi:hypothetical protein
MAYLLCGIIKELVRINNMTNINPCEVKFENNILKEIELKEINLKKIELKEIELKSLNITNNEQIDLTKINFKTPLKNTKYVSYGSRN